MTMASRMVPCRTNLSDRYLPSPYRSAGQPRANHTADQRRRRRVSTEQILVVADIDTAAQVVREFLTEFTVLSKGH